MKGEYFMAIGKRPKLTLGLKKKPEENDVRNEYQSTEKRPKLTLGLRKKKEWNKLEGETPNEKSTQPLTLGLKKKTEMIFQSQVETEPLGHTTNRPRSTLGLRSKPGIMRHGAERIRTHGKPSITKVPKTKGKLEVNIKISQLPTQVQTIKRGWQRFYVNVEGRIVQMKVRPKTWNKLLKANEEYSMWVASITGKMGHRIKDGFELLEPAIQVYEKKAPSPTTLPTEATK